MATRSDTDDMVWPWHAEQCSAVENALRVHGVCIWRFPPDVNPTVLVTHKESGHCIATRSDTDDMVWPWHAEQSSALQCSGMMASLVCGASRRLPTVVVTHIESGHCMATHAVTQ